MVTQVPAQATPPSAAVRKTQDGSHHVTKVPPCHQRWDVSDAVSTETVSVTFATSANSLSAAAIPVRFPFKLKSGELSGQENNVWTTLVAMQSNKILMALIIFTLLHRPRIPKQHSYLNMFPGWRLGANGSQWRKTCPHRSHRCDLVLPAGWCTSRDLPETQRWTQAFKSNSCYEIAC